MAVKVQNHRPPFPGVIGILYRLAQAVVDQVVGKVHQAAAFPGAGRAGEGLRGVVDDPPAVGSTELREITVLEDVRAGHEFTGWG